MSLAATKHHNCPTCRCTEHVDLDGMIQNGRLLEQARDILAEHHKWQCEVEGLSMEFERNGKTESVDISGEYGDSSLCEKTMSVLAALNNELKT